MIELIKSHPGPIIVKMGTRILTNESGALDESQIKSIAKQIADIRRTYNKKVILVSSGSIACGMESGKYELRDIPDKQAVASVGQVLLMTRYHDAFKSEALTIGQVLITRYSFRNEMRQNHAIDTINRLLQLGVVPIINENDTVSIEEIQFGDNDSLAALVATLIDASALILMTDTHGVYTANPTLDSNAKLLSELVGIDDSIFDYVNDVENTKSRGGMKSKLLAAKSATDKGVPTIICHGREPDLLMKLFSGSKLGTHISPLPEAMRSNVTIESQCRAAHSVRDAYGLASTSVKNNALDLMASAIERNADKIIQENKKDLALGEKHGLSKTLLDRLTLNDSRLKGMADSLRMIRKLDDPIGEVLDQWTLENKLVITKQRTPFGVIGIIYEARPNVTADAIGLALKSGNSVVLRGSKSARYSNKVISELLRNAAVEAGLPGEGIQLLEDVTHEGVTVFAQTTKYLDLVIPRGGDSLIKRVVDTAKVPSIETGVGNCHVYVDKDANLDMAEPIIINAKVQRPSVCNSAESVLIHADVADVFVPRIVSVLQEKGVEVRGCERTVSLASGVVAATEADWGKEYLDLIIAVKVVESLDEAISHIGRYGSMHSEAIITDNSVAAKRFEREIDAAAVLHNCSTRFTDGGEFGFGAEMGISTQKMHARGPMGLKEMTSYKYVVEGSGQIRG
ncbi:MAG: glutamate-5-semialdehyde dehydrogenase [bacterium]|nr:glutamate-5-semialdehyde dehydrogenase [bacterium]